ncbi:MAG TPA: AtpZ/AtpI family protein [Deltaproteobacteria bacterium]|nr:AtpZ/AtpI family protein [Deltaproteobacteria bacterium]HPJ93209.1 AtpZ/AtpI family protein [Deltaproteobacteria bacterium]HPR50872.1 AtpZ/AtpI family protein [Deltaproteobacteria bacterium]
MKKNKPYRLPKKLLARITRISAYSFVLVIMTFLGLYGGMYLDRLTNMAPNFTLLGLIIGIAIGFKGFIQEAITERRGQS